MRGVDQLEDVVRQRITRSREEPPAERNAVQESTMTHCCYYMMVFCAILLVVLILLGLNHILLH